MHRIIYNIKLKGFGHPLLTCPTFYFISSIVIPLNFVTELFIVIFSMKFQQHQKEKQSSTNPFNFHKRPNSWKSAAERR